MGYGGRSIKITAVLSEHGGEREKVHEELWRDLQARLLNIVKEGKYEDILPIFYGNGE